MIVETRDWKTALQRHLANLIRKAWHEYSSNSQLRKAWASAAAFQPEWIATLERQAMSTPPDQKKFTGELCGAIERVATQLIMPVILAEDRSPEAEELLDGMAAAF